MRTDGWQRPTLVLVSGGKGPKPIVLLPSGIVSRGSMREPTTHEVQLSALLNSFESRIATLESKFLGVLGIFINDTKILAKPYVSITDIGGIE